MVDSGRSLRAVVTKFVWDEGDLFRLNCVRDTVLMKLPLTANMKLSHGFQVSRDLWPLLTIRGSVQGNGVNNREGARVRIDGGWGGGLTLIYYDDPPSCIVAEHLGVGVVWTLPVRVRTYYYLLYCTSHLNDEAIHVIIIYYYYFVVVFM